MPERSAIVGVVFAVVLAFLVGLLCGRIANITGGKSYDASQMIREVLNEKNIKLHLRHLTDDLGWKTPGTKAEHKAANYIVNFWKSIGLSHVKATPYEIVVNYPDKNELNSFQIIDQTSDSVIFEANQFENLTTRGAEGDDNDDDRHLKSLFLSSSHPGVVKGQIVYVNYARSEDFEYLSRDIQQNISEFICIARYGKLARGIKALISEKHGCRALLLYSDPADYNAEISLPSYPLSWQMPEYSIQRGTLQTPYKGLADLMTPNYPSTEGAHRMLNTDTGLPKIPVHVLRSDDVRALFSFLGNAKMAPPDWQGGMHVQYKIGGNFTNSNMVGRVKVGTKNTFRTTYNVFGILEGKEEKDRYVMVGNHYDSWGPGAVDPSIGVAAMLELSRTLMEVHNTSGWRPRRSILFCAWGSEEIGSIGSREFVEEFEKIISLRTVAYLNVDVATLGNYSIKLKSQPLLKDVIFKALKTVPNPDETEVSKGHSTVYETYASRFPDGTDPSRPSIKSMNTGSDYVHFIGYTGVPCLDIRYTYNESTGIDFYPLYHTAYDDYHSFETFVDPSYKFTKAVTQLWGELAVRLSDEKIIPFSISEHLVNVGECVRKILRKLPGDSLNKWRDALEPRLNELSDEGRRFEESLKELDRSDEMVLRRANDQMMALERAFLYDDQQTGRTGVKNSMYAPSISGKQICFSRINDLLDGSTNASLRREIGEEMSKIITFLRATALLLKQPARFLAN